ncbi:FlgD immunoglobulin-like domain containing protein [Danxiaibacter flavus]|uniref:FlgD immunoglobulin-like domain containing protein n=1 Tax=Danxiaibacter flavus TaxID=3049108 RepID=A0ABV3ZLU6_9BACT|nr:FlgD immunoglobulin-like domain containing protein [Chitinophagaceae bacterium DXS]
MKQSLPGICMTAIFLLIAVNRIKAQSNYDIYVFNVKTGTTKQLTKIPGAGEYNVTWSNNGKKIAHDVVGPIASPYVQSIFVTDVETGVSVPLAGAEGGNDAAWSPDGKVIAFDDYSEYPRNIYSVPASGGSRTLLRYNSHHASWNPQGTKIAFDDNYGYIGSKDVNTGQETFVTYYGDRPAWSPNGQYIAFDGWGWAGGGVWIVKIDTAGNPVAAPIQLTTSGYGPTWKNNSKELVFIDWPDGDPNLYSIPVTGGVAKKIAGRIGGFDKGDYDPTYSNDGQYIAWSSYTDPASLLNESSREAATTKLSLQSKSLLVQNYPNPFADETTISFTVAQPSHVTINIYSLTGQKINTLTDAEYKAGSYQLQWDGRTKQGQNLASGIYLCQLKTPDGMVVKKMLRIR